MSTEKCHLDECNREARYKAHYEDLVKSEESQDAPICYKHLLEYLEKDYIIVKHSEGI